MSLETGTYISDLVATNPTSSDAKSQGDDHLRLLKSTVKATFPNVAGAVTPTHTELNYVDGVTSAIQGQIDSKGAITGQTWTGAHNFTTGTMTVATPTLGTHPATRAYADALAFAAALPGQAGNSGKFVTTDGTAASWADVYPSQTGNSGKFLSTDGTATSWAAVTPPQIVRSARTSNTILGVADSQKLIDITSGTFTQTFDAAATLGSGWYVYIRNTGTGVITLDPNASETIDGVTSGTLFGTLLIQCDGTNFNATRVGPATTIELLTSGTTWTAPIGVRKPKVRGVGGGGSGGKSTNTTPAVSGAGGGYFEVCVRVDPGTVYTYAIGAGGAAQSGNAAGSAGGSTTFSDGVTTYTGAGGAAGGAGAWLGSSSGGAGTNGTVNITGGPGGAADSSLVGVYGGDTPLGIGGASAIGAVSGVPPTGYGSGSAGGNSSFGSSAGKQGCIILEY